MPKRYWAVLAGAVILWSGGACSPVSAGQTVTETYLMDGKPVPKSFYDASVLMAQASELLRVNKNVDACKLFQQAVTLAPDYAEGHHRYGLALAKVGNMTAAVEQLKLATQLKPELDVSWLTLGGLLQSSGRLSEAMDAYQQFMTRFPRSKDAPKITSLMQGLQKEMAATNQAAKSDAAAAAAAGTDYFVEGTARGALHWPSSSMPLKVFIGDGSSAPGYLPEFPDVLKGSFESWSKASNGLITFAFVKNPADAVIECSWTADTKKFANSAEAGETRLTSSKGDIVKASLQLLTVPSMPGLNMTANRLRTICLHEIGHVLGLTGHTSNPDDAMFYSATIPDTRHELTQRDANTIVRLYTTKQ